MDTTNTKKAVVKLVSMIDSMATEKQEEFLNAIELATAIVNYTDKFKKEKKVK